MDKQERVKGLDAWVHHARGRYHRRKSLVKRLQKRAAHIHMRAQAMQAWSDAQLDEAMASLAEAVNRAPKDARGQLDEALALICECAWRTLGKRPYVVQIMGALALQQAYLAEMATGEGKTLTIGLAGVLAAWSARPCHILTANDYLAQRDAEAMQPLYVRCGVSVAACLQEMKPQERAEGYRCDLAYVTPKTLLADHLRDALAMRAGASENIVLPRGIHTAIVDEADSMLIDEAVTPLIISAPKPVPGLHEATLWAQLTASKLVARRDYAVDIAQASVRLLKPIDALTAHAPPAPKQWRSQERRSDLILQAIKVKELFKPGVQYLVDDDKIVLIDEFTGRLTPERSLSGGLHQAIEAKEGVTLTDPNLPVVQMTFQRFFQRFKRLACITGTAHEAATEFWHIYGMAVIRIPTNRPRQTRYWPLTHHRSREDKFAAIIALARDLSRAGAPVLIGLRSVADSHALSEAMTAVGLQHESLHALNHQREGEIIAAAAQPGTVTIATNMAGRGVDIQLSAPVLAQGGLHVLIAEHNDSRRVDRQLAGRCGRQGNPGQVYRFVALDDKIFLRQLNRWEHSGLCWASRLPTPLARTALNGLIKLCQSRFEKKTYGTRKAMLENEEWLDSALPFNMID